MFSHVTRSVIVLLALLGTTACGAPDRTLDNVLERGVLRVGMDASYPPFESVDADGSIVGFDVDLANAIAARMGVSTEFANISYDGLYDSLQIGTVDVLISALVAAPEFYGRAAFSEPYFNIGEHLVVPTGSTITTMQHLEGNSVAVEFGSGGDVEARVWQRRLAELDIIRVDTPEAAVEAVQSGEADAALVDGITAHLAAGEGLQIASAVNEALLAVAVHPESTALLAEIDHALVAIRQDGTLQQIIERWFNP
ncbi:MAG: substrate-binding periplasmic protein [Anaerolineae bacterium]